MVGRRCVPIGGGRWGCENGGGVFRYQTTVCVRLVVGVVVGWLAVLQRELLPPFISQTLRDGTPQVQTSNLGVPGLKSEPTCGLS